MTRPSAAEIEAAKTPAGGWTRATLEAWGVEWPPKRGWRQKLLKGQASMGVHRMQTKPFGFDLLRQQAITYIDGMVQEVCEFAPGDSEIEKLFWSALVARVWSGSCEYSYILQPTDPDHECRLLDGISEPGLHLIGRPQAQIADFRVDFLIHALSLKDSTEGSRAWRRLVVECDGHDFHERTKEQAAKDRSRDRALTSMDYDVFRFTGSELWRDPWACAEQVIDWAIKGWF